MCERLPPLGVLHELQVRSLRPCSWPPFELLFDIGLQPAFQNRPSPWPEWGRHQAGKPETEPKNFPASVVLCRTLVRRTPRKAGEDGREPLDDVEQWSDGDVSEEEDDEGGYRA